MRIYAAMAQKKRELISARTKAALAAAKARGTVLGGDRGYRPVRQPGGKAAVEVRRRKAKRTAHRLALQIQALRADGINSHAAPARMLTEHLVETPGGGQVWTHTTVARILTHIAA